MPCFICAGKCPDIECRRRRLPEDVDRLEQTLTGLSLDLILLMTFAVLVSFFDDGASFNRRCSRQRDVWLL